MKGVKYIQLGNLHDKQPPQDVELEKVVLGAIMLENKALKEVDRLLRPETFYHPPHIEIFRAIKELENEGKVDILTVTAYIRSKKLLDFVGGAYYIASLTNRVGSTANVEYHSRILVQSEIKRRLAILANGLAEGAYDIMHDCFDLLTMAETKIAEINSDVAGVSVSIKGLNDLMKEEWNDYEEKLKGKIGIDTGISALRQKSIVWRKSDLVVLAGRPGMGKTAFALSSVLNAVVNKEPVAFFSLEMPGLQLYQRLIANYCSVPFNVIRDEKMPDSLRMEVMRLQTILSEMPLYIEDTANQSIASIIHKAIMLKNTKDVKLIVIDYLGLIDTPELHKGTNPEQRVAHITKALKQLAKQLEIPIILLAQLSRAVETRGGDKRPQLSDLRDSGSIEQDADMVIFVYRPEYYGFTFNGDQQPYPENLAEIIVAKYRNGQPETIPTKFIGKFQRFTDFNDTPTNFSEPLKPNGNFDDEPF